MSNTEIEKKLEELRKLYVSAPEEGDINARSKTSIAFEGRCLRFILERRKAYRKTLFDDEQPVVV